MQPFPDFGRGAGAAAPFGAGDHHPGGGHTCEGCQYGQRAWLRQLEPVVTGEMEDAVVRTIARLDGTPSPPRPGSRRGGCSAAGRPSGARHGRPAWRAPAAPRCWP